MKSAINISILFLSFICLLYAQQINGQDIMLNDSLTNIKKNINASDTAVQEVPQLYKEIQKVSDKKQWTSKLYDALIQNPSTQLHNINQGPIDDEYKAYTGMIIRKINVIVLDPFGTNVYNPDSANTSNKFNKIINKVHPSTKEFIIRKNLQFKEGQPVNPLIIAETEAFLRNTGYISDARIKVDSIPQREEVDITVVVRDVFSLGLSIHNLSLSKVDIEVFDKNFLGFGNRYNIDFIYKKDYPRHYGYGLGYQYNNFFRSFINLQGEYVDNIDSRNSLISIERPLLPTIDYFGQISYNNLIYRTDIVSWDSITPDYNKDFSITLGKAITIPNPDYVKRFVMAARYYLKYPDYKDWILPSDITPYKFIKRRMWITQLSLYQQAYYREHLIHSFGVTENIAQGYNISTQFGLSWIEKYNYGTYGSISVSAGKQFHSGNYYVESTIASYFNKKEAYEGVAKLQLRYFSPLLRIGKNRLRQFVNIDYCKLLNPEPDFEHIMYYSKESTMNTGRYTEEMKGTERLIINSETDIFSNLNLIGFRFLFYGFADLGWITPQYNLLKSDNMYGGLGIGVRIRNDLLVFKTLDIRIGWYPKFSQNGVNDYINVATSNPTVSPDFAPKYPQEIVSE